MIYSIRTGDTDKDENTDMKLLKQIKYNVRNFISSN